MQITGILRAGKIKKLQTRKINWLYRSDSLTPGARFRRETKRSKKKRKQGASLRRLSQMQLLNFDLGAKSWVRWRARSIHTFSTQAQDPMGASCAGFRREAKGIRLGKNRILEIWQKRASNFSSFRDAYFVIFFEDYDEQALASDSGFPPLRHRNIKKSVFFISCCSVWGKNIAINCRFLNPTVQFECSFEMQFACL